MVSKELGIRHLKGHSCRMPNSCAVCLLCPGLCIELWKVTKVVQVELDRENLIAGVFPRIVFVDQPSYTSSTKEYDMVNIIGLPFYGANE